MAGFAPEVLALLEKVLGGGGGVGEMDSLVGLGRGVSFYVDGDNGDDGNDGSSWANAFQTIQAAITASNALVDWTWKKMNTIWVMPGLYPENLDGDILMTHIVGLGIRGTDTQVEIHPPTGSVLARVLAASCNLVGAHLANLWLEVNKAVPILDIEVANNSIIEHCQFYFNEDVAVTGIDTEDCHKLTVRYCDFTDGIGKFFYRCIANHGGAGKFANDCRYHDNNMHAYDCGIWIEDTCRGTQTIIKQNVIQVNGAFGDALAGIGIDDNDGQTLCIDNWIAALDAIDHPNTATRCIANHIIDGASVGAVEANNTD